MEKFNVIIVGAGPAGIFCALELSKLDNIRILLVDKGNTINGRACPAKSTECKKCSPCNITSGFGGAGAFSDGKLMLNPNIGGWLYNYIQENKLKCFIDRVDRIYLQYGAPTKLYGDIKEIAGIDLFVRNATLHDLNTTLSKVRHIGTDICKDIVKKMYNDLSSRGVYILHYANVKHILTSENEAKGVILETDNGEETIYADAVVVAPGRSGAEWFYDESRLLGLNSQSNKVDIGVRVEVPYIVAWPMTRYLYEAKLEYYSKCSEDRVRTFCMNPHGEVIKEYYDDVLTVNGHAFTNKQTDNTNFALLVDKEFTEPFNEPVAYGKYIASLANMLGNGIIVQKLGDLRNGRRSTAERMERGKVKPTLKDATPGDLSLVLPSRYMNSILEMIDTLNEIAPGINSRDTLLYGVEVKFYNSKLEVDSNLETKIKNLYGAGDGVGITRGLVQASASGLIVAESIKNKLV